MSGLLVSALIIALLCIFSSTVASQALSCGTNPSPGIVQQCTGSGTVGYGQATTFSLSIPSDPKQTLYEGFDVDMEARLTSVTGNVDLQLIQPSGASVYSSRKVGDDIVFVSRNDFASGTYSFVVSGMAATTNFIFTVYITSERELGPAEQLTMGQFLITCCNQSPQSCLALKQAYPTLSDADNSTNPNYCYIPGNVCTRDGHMDELSMPGNNMSCFLPVTALQSLSRLERIDLSGNGNITGNITTIANTLGQAAHLEFLDLSGNQISGALHTACGLAYLGSMEQIALAHNLISGSIPSCLVSIKSLVELRLDANLLIGGLPTIQSAKSSKLTYYTAANQTDPYRGKGLNGTIPSLLDLSRLMIMDFSGNALGGTLPDLPINLWEAHLSNCNFSGTIPGSYGQLQSLQHLNMANNTLSGFLPATIAAAPALVYLDLSSNQLSGTLPSVWSTMQLCLLSLNGNTLSGIIPGALATLQGLIALDLSSNQFSGTLEDFAFQTEDGRNDLNSVTRYVNFANNTLTGVLDSYSGLEDLGVFTPQAFALTGTNFPGADRNLTFSLAGNSLTGVYPQWLFDALVQAPAPVNVNLSGNILTCPLEGFAASKGIPSGRLAGQICQRTLASGSIVQSPLTDVVSDDDDDLSGGAIFGIIIAVLIACGALGGIGWWVYKQRQQRSSLSSFAGGAGGFGAFQNYPPQGRSESYNSFVSGHDNRAWDSAPSTEISGLTTAKKPASIPLSQRGEF